ncbi:alpha/beta hydrolase family protein [Roseobacter sp.]|uniref:alpha/beta hydrolase family protein n=1 Tax=Roseobacter sp. TaxID=1907202 RepID=UPI0038583EC3
MIFSDGIRIRASNALTTVIALLVLCGCSTSTSHTYDPAQEVEYRYGSVGPYTVARIKVPATFDQPGGAAYFPENHFGPAPLVIWQNGTGEPIGTYDAIAHHLASWGIAVLGSHDRQMGSGVRAIEMLENAHLWSATQDHPFFERISPNIFALVGSSQGAVSTINAHTRFAVGRNATALAIHGTPTKRAIDFFGLNLNYDARAITVPVLVMTGTEDEFISPIRLNQAIFDGLTGPGLRVLAVADGADHIELADDAGRFRGYLTSWLAFHLLEDVRAAQAFIGRAEIMSNSGWEQSQVTQ